MSILKQVLILSVCCLLLTSLKTEASEIDYRLYLGNSYSYHFDDSYKYNDTHNTLIGEVRYERFSLGGGQFTNSYYEKSTVVYGGYSYFDSGDSFAYLQLSSGVQIGAATGYEKNNFNINGVLPIVGIYGDISAFQSGGAKISLWGLSNVNVQFYLEF